MGSIKFPHTSGNSMSIAAPATNPASDLELKLPATIGTAGQVLKNSSTPGTLEFGDDSAGKIIQWKHSTKTDVSSRTHSTFIDIPGTDETGSGSIFECNITTTGTNKVLVIPNIMVSSSNMSWLKLIRNTGGTDTDLAKGDAATSKRDIYWGAYAGGGSTGSMYYGVMPITGQYLDSPGAGTHSYRCQFASDGTSYVMYINRCVYDLDPYHPRTQSAITLLELAA